MFSSFYHLFQVLPQTASTSLFIGLIFLIISLWLSKRSYTKAICVFLLSCLFTGFAFAEITPYLHLWDEQFHALVAKNLSETPLTPRLLPEVPVNYNFTNWNENHIWLHKPPLTLWQIALSFKLFGISVFTTRLASILLLVGTVFLVYKIGSLVKNQKVGFYAAVIFGSLNYVYTLVSGLHTAEHIDIAFQFYITLSCFFWLKYYTTERWYWILLMGVFSGAAILTKWLVGLLVYAGAGLSILSYRHLRLSKNTWLHLSLAFLATLMVSIPWQVYTATAFPLEFWHETTFSSRHFHEVIEDHGGNWLFYWDNLKTIYGVGGFGQVVIVLSLLFSFMSIKKQYVLFFIVTILTPYLFFSLASTKMDSFLVIVQPLVCVLISGFVIKLSESMTCLNYSKWKPYIGMVAVICIALMLLRPNQIKRDFLLDNTTNRAIRDSTVATHKYIQTFEFPDEKKIVLYNINYYPAIHVNWMFHHDVIAYQRDFTKEEIKFLLANNYRLYTFVENSLKPIQNP